MIFLVFFFVPGIIVVLTILGIRIAYLNKELHSTRSVPKKVLARVRVGYTPLEKIAIIGGIGYSALIVAFFIFYAVQ